MPRGEVSCRGANVHNPEGPERLRRAQCNLGAGTGVRRQLNKMNSIIAFGCTRTRISRAFGDPSVAGSSLTKTRTRPGGPGAVQAPSCCWYNPLTPIRISLAHGKASRGRLHTRSYLFSVYVFCIAASASRIMQRASFAVPAQPLYWRSTDDTDVIDTSSSLDSVSDKGTPQEVKV